MQLHILFIYEVLSSCTIFFIVSLIIAHVYFIFCADVLVIILPV